MLNIEDALMQYNLVNPRSQYFDDDGGFLEQNSASSSFYFYEPVSYHKPDEIYEYPFYTDSFYDNYDSFFAYKDVSTEDSDEVRLNSIPLEEYYVSVSDTIGLLGASFEVIDDDMASKLAWKHDQTEVKNPDIFDKLRILLRSTNVELVPTGKHVGSDGLPNQSMKNILCSFFEIPDCHSFRIHHQFIDVYFKGGSKSSDKFDQFLRVMADFYPVQKKPAPSIDVTKYENCKSLTFSQFFLQKYSIDISEFEKYLPVSLRKSNWTNEEKHISRFYENLGDSVILQYAVTAFMPQFPDISKWSEYRGSIVSNENIAVNAILSNWSMFFPDYCSGYMGSLADLCETVLGIVYEYYDRDPFKVNSFLSDMNFGYYVGKDERGDVARNFVNIVKKHISKGRRIWYEYPHLFVYDDSSHYAKRLFAPVLPSSGVQPMKDSTGSPMKLKNLRSYIGRHCVYSNMPPLYEKFQNNLEVLADMETNAIMAVPGDRRPPPVPPDRRIGSSTKSDLSQSDDDFPLPLTYVKEVSSGEDLKDFDATFEVDYSDYADDSSSHHISALYHESNLKAFVPDYQYQIDPRSPSHKPLFKTTLSFSIGRSDYMVVVFDAPNKASGKRVAASVAMQNLFYND
jgi:hypothetical protein